MFSSEFFSLCRLNQKTHKNRQASEVVYGEDSKTSKSFSKFIVRLSESIAGQVLKEMVVLQTQVDSEVNMP